MVLWLWLLFLGLVLIVLLVYGVGHRRWGIPYPRFVKGTEWGLMADVLWFVLAVAIVTLLVAILA